MDTNEINDALKEITSLAEESAEVSRVQSQRLKEATGFLITAEEKSVQASRALSSWRLLRYFRLRHEKHTLLAQARALIRVPKEISARSQVALLSARALEERARKLQ